ncbi:Der1-like family-domain-containing protein [Mycena belliarum]|uniref:Derlin n=1 Tax=Mycena belliarum TaxID=1033014 RepID=A0AAD6XET0_9AGAR|nr:Der1-like family-domain-containing protein [Mycena belliae]
MSELIAEIKKIPPVTRFVVLSSLAVSLSTMMGLVSAYKVVYTYGLVFEKLQVWRIYTSFFLGRSGIAYIFDLINLYRSMDQIESGPYTRRSADLAWQLFAASVAIMITSIPVSSLVFFRPFLLCVVYVSSSLAPVGAQTSIMGLVHLPIRYLPYIMLGMDLLMEGPGAVAAALPGAVVGHLWWWGVWGPEVGGAGGVLAPWGAAPVWLREWMGQGDVPPPPAGRSTGANSGGGVHIIPPRRQTRDAAPAATTGYQWGQGQRLGQN